MKTETIFTDWDWANFFFFLLTFDLENSGPVAETHSNPSWSGESRVSTVPKALSMTQPFKRIIQRCLQEMVM